MATTPSQTSIEKSQTVDTTIISTVEVANGIGAKHAHRSLGIDAGPLDQVAVGPPSVPAQRLSHEPADDLVRVGLGDVPHHDARVGAPHDDADRPDEADTDDHADADQHSVPPATSPSSKRGMITLSITHPTAKLDAIVQMANTAAPETAMRKSFGWTRIRARMKAALRRVCPRAGAPLPSELTSASTGHVSTSAIDP